MCIWTCKTRSRMKYFILLLVKHFLYLRNGERQCPLSNQNPTPSYLNVIGRVWGMRTSELNPYSTQACVCKVRTPEHLTSNSVSIWLSLDVADSDKTACRRFLVTSRRGRSSSSLPAGEEERVARHSHVAVHIGLYNWCDFNDSICEEWCDGRRLILNGHKTGEERKKERLIATLVMLLRRKYGYGLFTESFDGN